MIDAHCHLQEIDEEEWLDTDIETMVCNSTGINDSQKAIGLANKYHNVRAAIGMGYSPEYGKLDEQIEALEKLIVDPKVVAVGEIGLDYWDGMREENKQAQIEMIKKQIRVAEKYGKPVIVHNRNSGEDLLKFVDYDKVVMHCFSGSMEFMKKCIERGWYISFGGILTFKRSGELRDVAKEVPDELVLSETDAPYLAPEPVRGSKNVPANVKYVISCLAEVRRVTEENIDRTTSINARRVFRLV